MPFGPPNLVKTTGVAISHAVERGGRPVQHFHQSLGIEIEDRPFAKSTLQMFRAQLILHDKVREVFAACAWLGSRAT